MNRPVFVAGVAMTRFEKPGRRDWGYADMVREAGTAALADAGIAYHEVQQVVTGHVYGDSCSGHRAVYELGETGVPVYSVSSNCSTGSSALMLARALMWHGLEDTAIRRPNPASGL